MELREVAKVIKIYLAGRELLESKIGDLHFIIHSGNLPGGSDSEPAIILNGEFSENDHEPDEDSKYIITIKGLEAPYAAMYQAKIQHMKAEKND